jgi:transposase
MSAFESADRLAGICGLAPVPRDSGRISGNLKRPRRYHRKLLRTCYLAAQSAARTDPASRAYYDRKRAEGKHHRQAVLALARRRPTSSEVRRTRHLLRVGPHSVRTKPRSADWSG